MTRRISFLCLLSFSLFSCIHTPETHPRPTTWATPIKSDQLSNLHQVSPELYRCALPDEEGYAKARDMGIETIINLRPNKASAEALSSIPQYVNIPVKSSAPTYDQAREFFKIVDDPANQPVLLHCYHGADRTGAFTALYRINRQGWTEEEAIREMTGGGYKFHTMWESLIDWVREAPEF